MYLSKETKAEIFAKHGGKAENTGSAEGQIALFTFRIQALSEHLRSNKKDHSCRRSLLHLVGKRKQLLQYLHHKDLDRYKKVLDQLGLRK